MKEMYYCILLDERRKLFDVSFPVYNDELFYISVKDANSRGICVKASVVPVSSVSSRDDLLKDNDPIGYKYHAGLFVEYDVKY